jgi:hypothetical protein
MKENHAKEDFLGVVCSIALNKHENTLVKLLNAYGHRVNF